MNQDLAARIERLEAESESQYERRFESLGPSNHVSHDHWVRPGPSRNEASGTLSAHAELWRNEQMMVTALRYQDRFRAGPACGASRSAYSRSSTIFPFRTIPRFWALPIACAPMRSPRRYAVEPGTVILGGSAALTP